MNKMEPIIVKPSRWKWGFPVLLAIPMIGLPIYILVHLREAHEIAFGIFALFFFGSIGVMAAWETIRALPRIVIDDDGVGGRFIGGGFIGVNRISWDDIIAARVIEEHFVLIPVILENTAKYLALDVKNSADGKYRPARKYWSAMARRDKRYKYAFVVTYTKLNDEQMQEVVDTINRHARGKRD